MSIPKQTYLSNCCPGILRIDPKSRHQDPFKMETIQKSTELFKKTVSQNRSNYMEDHGFFEDLDFLIRKDNAFINPDNTDYIDAKHIEPVFIEKSTHKESQNNSLRFLLSATKSVQKTINNKIANNTDQIVRGKKYVKHTREFKQIAINMVCSGQPVKQVSKNLKIPYETLKQWIEKHKLQNLELLLSNSQNHSNFIDTINSIDKLACRNYTQHPKTRRQHPPEIRQKAINMLCSGQNVLEVSKNLNIPSITLRKWMKKHKLQNLELLLSNYQNYSLSIEDFKVLEGCDLFKDLDFIHGNNDINPYDIDSTDKQIEPIFAENLIHLENQNDNLESLLSVAESIQFMAAIPDHNEITINNKITNKTTNTDILFTCL
ncbi:MAG: transposase [Candidatus Rhabdochlamydia sp.]